MIHASIFGRIGKDPESRTHNGTDVVSFPLAADHGWGDKKSTTWVNVSVWGARGKVVRDRMKKGQTVLIHGEVWEDTWTDRDGNERKSLKCSADQVEITDWGNGSGSGSGSGSSSSTSQHSGGQSAADDDIPF